MQDTTSRPSKMRWYQYRLRTLLILLTLAAVALAAFKTYVEPFRAQRRAAERLAALGARIEYRPGGPAWLRAVAGEERFLDVVMVHLEHQGFKDDDLAALADLPRLERLYLAQTPVSDEGLRHVAGLRRLQRMSLWNTRITDEGLAHLAGLGELEVLDVQGTPLSEAALEHFRGHPNLKLLIHRFPVGDAGLDALASIPQLQVAHLACIGVTDKGLERLARLRPLRSLTIESDRITDAGVARLARLESLDTLVLASSAVGDAGLASLVRLERLQWLTLKGCAVGDAAVARLASLPKLHSLELDSVPVSGDCVAALAEGSALESLTLRGTNVPFAEVARHFGARARRLSIGPERIEQTSYRCGDRHHGALPGPHDVTLHGPVRPDDVEHLEHYVNIVWLLIERLQPEPAGPRQGGESPPRLDFDIGRADCLERLPRLETLEINATLDDRGAALLGRLRPLRSLSLGGRQAVSPEGYRHLARLEGLTHLSLRSCGLTDEHLVFLAEMPQLEILEIPGNRITAAGIDHLRNLSTLRRLNVSFCPEIDDEAFKKISRLESLEDLSAQTTGVTDAGLTYLFDMPYLRDVTVLGSRATQRGIRALRGALPTQGGRVY